MTTPIEARRLYRVTDGRVAAGVAAGIAAHLNASVTLVRIAFVVLASFSGLGALLYAAFWAVLPTQPGERTSTRNRRQVVPFVALGVGILLVQALSGTGGVKSVIGWLVAIVAVGVGIIWRQADPKRRERWTATVPQAPWLGAVLETDRRGLMLRLVGGGALVVAGIIGTVAVASGADLSVLANGLLFAGLALAGVGLALAPLLWRVFGQLRAEREARIREQERADIAAMIHDQVLHTLALIQRNAGDTKAVLRLARGQERTLRGWLYKSTASPAERFGAALEEAAAEVEDTYTVAVEVVIVGDRDVDDRIRALVAAAREAMVNAGKHAEVSSVSLYAEVEPDQASVFVRDRGVGFDPGAVDDDRHGVRGSIIGRMKRHGGRAEIRSEPGEGTEVRLFMPTPGWSPVEEKEKISE
ncbi:PspC domain-containing protein [Planosporangium sp. 12N6]|uniref:ATP-binding protein n=1 Tax=Planosporangium spinosum TaxID=3402278 RepID=UPI003CF48357